MKIVKNVPLDLKVINFPHASKKTILEQCDIEGTDDGSGGSSKDSSGGDKGGSELPFPATNTTKSAKSMKWWYHPLTPAGGHLD
jgi:hypothetical protein